MRRFVFGWMGSMLAAALVAVSAGHMPAAAQHAHGARDSGAGAASARDSSAATSVSSAEDFIRHVREGTERFHSLDEAIAAGYRLVGPDFPGMGEHWVNIQVIMAKRVEPARPAILSYLRVDGEAVLTGAAFAVPLRPGDAPPVLPFPVTWHQHGGTIADETLHLNPHAMEAAPDAPQLAMIHAWVWTENPAGAFAQQNWALPFHRLGLDAPEGVTPAAGKAAHLAAGGVAYYEAVIERAGRPSAAEMAAVRDVLDRHSAPVHEAIAAWSDGGVEARVLVDRLAGIWKSMWEDLLPRLEPDVAARVRPLAG